MATFGVIPLPYTATSSGKIMDTAEMTLGSTTVEREILVVGDPDAHTALAVVTSSYGLSVDLKTTAVTVLTSGPLQVLTSGALVLSSAGITQSMLVTSSGQNLYSTLGVTVATTGPLTLSGTVTVLSASSGVVQTLTSGPDVLSSASIVSAQLMGTSGSWVLVTTSGALSVTLGTAGAGSTAINVVGTSGAIAPATSSGGLLVTFTNASAGGSTQVNIQGSTGTLWAVSSVGAGTVELSSDLTKGTLLVRFTTSLPAPITVSTLPARLFSVTVATTGAISTVLHVYNTATCALSSGIVSAVGTFALPAAAGSNAIPFSARGVVMNTGIQLGNVLTNGSTAVLGIINYLTVEYQV